MIAIQTAEVKDCAEIATLVNSAYRGEYSKKGWTTEADLLGGQRADEEMIRDIIRTEHNIIFKNVDEGRITGCCHLRMEAKRAYVGMLTVEPLLQSKGIGKKLLAHAENVAAQQGADEMYMTVITQRVELIEWYERCGYKKTNQKVPFKTGDPRYGIPRVAIEFVILSKGLS